MGPAVDAKRPVTRLAGPYGHPFHPILVTVPIGAWVASIVFDVVSRFADDPEPFTTASYWLIGIGVVGAAVAAVFGVMDLMTIPRGTAAFRTGVVHMVLNLAVAATFAVSFLFRAGDLGDPDGVALWLIVLSAVALGVLGVSGWLGGKLTYRYGVRVVDEATQQEGFARHS